MNENLRQTQRDDRRRRQFPDDETQRGRVDLPESACPFPHPVNAQLEKDLGMVSPRSREPSRRPIVSIPEPGEQDEASEVWDDLGDFA
jgi:hypothetical protein